MGQIKTFLTVTSHDEHRKIYFRALFTEDFFACQEIFCIKDDGISHISSMVNNFDSVWQLHPWARSGKQHVGRVGLTRMDHRISVGTHQKHKPLRWQENRENELRKNFNECPCQTFAAYHAGLRIADGSVCSGPTSPEYIRVMFQRQSSCCSVDIKTDVPEIWVPHYHRCSKACSYPSKGANMGCIHAITADTQ